MREVRKVFLGRYEYTLYYEEVLGNYWVKCRDMVRTANWLDHGPFLEEEGHEFIVRRVRRDEELRRS